MILSKTVMILFITREPMEPECSYRSHFEANLILCQMVINIGSLMLHKFLSRWWKWSEESNSDGVLKASDEV